MIEQKQDKQAQNDLQEFAVALFHRLKSNQNLVFSPASIYLALSMAAIGSEGVTQSEFKNVLSFTSREQLLNLITITQMVLTMDKNVGVNISIANKIFEDLPSLNKEYEELIKSNLSAIIEKVDFQQNPNATRLSINSWVEDVTQKKIIDLLPPESIDSSTKMVLVNAIYFKGTWQYRFDAKKTIPSKFQLAYGNAGKLSDMQLMQITKDFYYCQDNFQQYISIPYEGNQYAMEIILPKNIQEYEKTFSESSFKNARAKKQLVQVYLGLPKFKVQETDIDNWKNILQNMGLKNCFENTANFSFMDPLKLVKVSNFFHKAIIEVNEEGAEAAAASALCVNYCLAPLKEMYSMLINSPFFYSITHLHSSTSIFLGKITHPTY